MYFVIEDAGQKGAEDGVFNMSRLSFKDTGVLSTRAAYHDTKEEKGVDADGLGESTASDGVQRVLISVFIGGIGWDTDQRHTVAHGRFLFMCF